jgi:hypothetical protein
VKTATVAQKERVLITTDRRIIPGTRARFEWRDLARLGGTLSLAEDSSWLPPRLAKNLLRTIRFVLDPANARKGTPLSMAIGLQDLYHAHIAMPVGEIPLDLLEHRNRYKHPYSAAIDEAFPDFLDEPTAEQRAAIRRVDAATVESLRVLLEHVERRLPDAGMIYHPYENSKPQGMTSDDPRRQIFVPLSEAAPTVGVDFWSYSTILQISFLVSPQGEVFVRGPHEVSLRGLEFRAELE